jgi:hypothetical protein
MAGVMNISLPTLRAGFDKLATTANNVGTAFTTMGNNAKTALGKVKVAMAGVGKLQGTLSGQVSGTVGATVLLSEFFTFNDDTSKFENGIVEKMRSGISNAINKYTPLDTDQANLGAKLATIIGGAVGAFAVVSAVGGAIGALLLNPVVLTAAAIAFTAYIATSESEMADNIRAFLLNALKQVGQIAVKLSLDGVEAVLNAPLNAITGSEGNVQDRQSKAIIQNNKDGNLLDGALIASNTNTLFRGMTEQQVKDARELWQTELDKLMAGNAFERFINSGSIGIFEGAIERAGERLDRIGKAKFGQDTGVGLRSTYNDLLPPAPVKKALGGFISGAGTATSDSIPAMLSDGEFVMKASAVSKFGAGFMAKINAGIMPQMFSQGGGVKANPEALQRLYDEQAKDQKAISGYKVSLPTSSNGFSNGLSDADVGIYEALKTNIAERAADIASLEAKNVKASSSESSSGSSSSSTETKQQKATNKAYGDIGKGYAEQFERTFAKGLKEGLKTGSFKDFIPNLLDSFTSGVVDSFVDGLTATLFEGKIGKDGKRSGGFTGALGGLFGGQARIGSTVAGEDVAKSDIEVLGGGKDALGLGGIFDGAKEWMSGLFGEGGGLSGIFEGFSGGLSSIFGGLGSALGGLFGGGSGGSGGGLGSLLSIGAGFLGFSQGGIVPNTATSQIGKDSVPAMLMPGEVVLSKNDVSRMDNGPAPQQTTFNLKVVGNVDRETRRNIVKMMPQIAQGVNGQNKENNYGR